jgi:hypothetical protein
MPRHQVTYVTVPLSGTLSEQALIAGASTVAVRFPVVTSGTALLQGSPDVTSTNFVRVQNAAGSGDFTMTVAAGSKAFTLDAYAAFPYIRIEMQNAQSTAVSLAVITRW